MHVKKNHKDSHVLMGVSYTILIANTARFCYGNYLYYNTTSGNEFCNPIPTTAIPQPTQQNAILASTMRMMLWIGYMTMFKCCLYSMIACIGIPCLYFYIRRQERGDHRAIENNVMTDLAVSKFGDLVRNNDSNTNCIICFEDFTEEDKVTVLPCNAKHSFHEKCIKSWLSTKNTCPLCNAPVTKERLAEARANP